MAELIKKYKIALFVNSGTIAVPNWVRVKKSTAFNLAMNPVTNEFDYIADETPTTELDHYAPSLNQALTMYKSEPDYEAIFPKFFNMHVGSDASMPVLIVFYQEPVDGLETHTHFEAWHAPNARFVANELDSVAGTLTCDLYFNGGIETGYVTVADGVPTFTAGPLPAVPVITTNLDATKSTAVATPITLTIVATKSDAGTLSYAWYKDGSVIGSATSSTYQIDADSAGDSGVYYCVVTNTLAAISSSKTSASCTVTVA